MVHICIPYSNILKSVQLHPTVQLQARTVFFVVLRHSKHVHSYAAQASVEGSEEGRQQENCISLFIGGSIVEYVDSRPHLGHVISNTGDDRHDIINRRNSLCAQINNVLCYFMCTSIIVKMKLRMSYCNSHYGPELLDLGNT